MSREGMGSRTGLLSHALLLASMVILGSCNETPRISETQVDRRATREFYLQCVGEVTRSSYGRGVLDLVQECRQAAVEIK